MIRQTELIPITDIEVGKRLRQPTPDAVDHMVVSIRELGLLTPITIQPNFDSAYILVAGATRLAAVRAMRTANTTPRRTDMETMNIPAMKTTATIRKNLSVEISIGPEGMKCCWTPSVPPRLTGPQFEKYRSARDALLAEAAAKMGQSILVVGPAPVG
jgi:hypothetical protein